MTVGTDSMGALRPRRLRPLHAAALGLALALGACGGGDRVSTFAPNKVIVFGDESSVIVGTGTTDAQGNAVTAPVGSKYTVNALKAATTTGEIECQTYSIWVQALASHFGFDFAECPLTSFSRRGTIYAKVGARVADIPAQVAAYNATSAFSTTDLVTLMIGQRDLIEAYQTATSEGDCTYESGVSGNNGSVAQQMRNLGVNVANQVNGIAQAGGRVLIATLPPQGETPFAAAENATHTDFVRSVCLNSLTRAFNGGLRAALINDGRLIGLVQADEQVQLSLNFPAGFGYISTATAACNNAAPSLPTCTTATLVTGASAGNYLWADDRHLNVDMHSRIGNVAISRAVNNPF